MGVDDYLLNKSSADNWQHMTPLGGHVQLTPTFINDAAAIIEKLTTSGRVGKFFQLSDVLNKHITNEEVNPHGFSIENFREELIAALYEAYRIHGYSGTVEDMFSAIFQYIKVVTYAEATKGVEDTKAVNASMFSVLFKKHSNNINSHLGMLTSFLPEKAFNNTPSFAFKSRYIAKDYFAEYFNSGTFQYLINDQEWNPYAGTIVLEFTHTNILESQELISLSGNGKSISVSITEDEYLRIDRTGYLTYPRVFDRKLSLDTGGNKKLVLSILKSYIL